MLPFFWDLLLLALQHFILQFVIMPSFRKTVEKVIGPSPSTRAILLQAELRRIREDGEASRALMGQIIEERNRRETLMRRDRQRMRMAGILGSEELEMMLVAEERLRRGGITTGRLLTPEADPGLEEDLGRFVEVEERAGQTEAHEYGPLRMVEEEPEVSTWVSCSWWFWLGMLVLVLVLAVVGLAAMVGALTRPYIL